MRWTLIVALASLLGGCGWFGGGDTGPKPSELTPLEAEFEPKTLWSVDVGAGSGEYFLRLSPAVAHGRVYVATHEGTVAAYDAGSGKTIWRTETEAPISGAVGVAGDLVLVGTSDARVLAFGNEEGKQIWSADVSSEVLAPPAGNGNTVAVRTVDGRLQALAPSEGKRRWAYDQNTPVLTLRGTSAPVVIGDAVIAAFDNGSLAALQATDGELLWDATVAVPRGRSELERVVDVDGDPVVRGGRIYAVSYQGRMVAVEQGSGDILWDKEMSSSSGLAVNDAGIYVTDSQDRVWALARRNGASLWKQDKLLHRSLTRPVATGNHAVVGDFEGYLHWLSQEDGHIAARNQVNEAPILAAPTVAGDVIYVYDAEGRLTALTASSETSSDTSDE